MYGQQYLLVNFQLAKSGLLYVDTFSSMFSAAKGEEVAGDNQH
jgi:hypothetical protein